MNTPDTPDTIEYSDDKKWTKAELLKFFSKRIQELSAKIDSPLCDKRILAHTLEVNNILYQRVLKSSLS